MSFLGKFVGATRGLQCNIGMQFFRHAIPFFVVLGRGTMRLRSQFVLLERLFVKLVHSVDAVLIVLRRGTPGPYRCAWFDSLAAAEFEPVTVHKAAPSP